MTHILAVTLMLMLICVQPFLLYGIYLSARDALNKRRS